MRSFLIFSHQRGRRVGLSAGRLGSSVGLIARDSGRLVSDREIGRVRRHRRLFQPSSAPGRELPDQFGVGDRWRQQADKSADIKAGLARGGKILGIFIVSRRTAEGVGHVAYFRTDSRAASCRSKRSGGSPSASTNPSTRCSASSGTILATRARFRCFWPATRRSGASRPCCPPRGTRSPGIRSEIPKPRIRPFVRGPRLALSISRDGSD